MITGVRVLAALVCSACFAAAAASAEDFPAKPVTIVVAYAAGGATDVIARAVAQRLTETWGSQVVIENKGGASTQIGTAYVAKAPPDGYTLLATADSTFTVNPYLFRKLAYDADKDFLPVAGLGAIHEVLVVNAAMPVSNIADVVALAKAKPGELSYGSLGVGSPPHLSMELFKSMTGVKINAVQYRGGGPALANVIGGHIPMIFISVGLMEQPWRAGQLKALGIGSPQRLANLPDLPAVAETVPNYQASFWFGLFAPTGTPRAVAGRINADVQRIIADPDFHARFLAPNFFEPVLGSLDAIAARVRSDTVRWGAVVRDAHIVGED